MVYASHVIFGAYGFWLPNDPRGSWSEWVGAWELFRYGEATKTTSRRSVAATPHNRQARREAKEELKYPAVRFTGLQAQSVGHGFRQFAERSGLTIWSCAIMPDHVHLVVARHRYEVEKAVILLKGAAARVLEEQNLHPMAKFPRMRGRLPKCWARGEWKVYLEDERDILRAIAYVENNPIKEGLPPQRWLCVTPFTGLGGMKIAPFSRDSKRSAR